MGTSHVLHERQDSDSTTGDANAEARMPLLNRMFAPINTSRKALSKILE